MCSMNDDPSTYDEEDDEPLDLVPTLTVTCPKCGLRVGEGLLAYDNHMREHEFFGGEDAHLEMAYEDSVNGGIDND